MGVRQERRERRAKAEEEVRQALEDSLKKIGDKKENWTFVILHDKAQAKLSQDTKSRFPDIIKYEMLGLIHDLEDKGLIKERRLKQ